MAIEIRQEQAGDVRILALSGRLDTETAADVELALQDLLGAGERQFLIDLSGIGYVSSAGLRVLLALAKQLDGGKGSLRLCGLNASVAQVFEVAGFSKLFAIFSDRAAALGQVAKTRPTKAPENPLAKNIAALFGLPSVAAPPNPQAAELARLAAKLLGLEPGIAAVSKSAVAVKAGVTSMPRIVAPRPVAAPSVGLLDKLKRLFGAKS